MAKSVTTALLLLLALTSGCVLDHDGGGSKNDNRTDISGIWVVSVYEHDASSLLYLNVEQSGGEFSVSGGVQSENGVLTDSTFTFSYETRDDRGRRTTYTVTGTVIGDTVSGTTSGDETSGSWTGTIIRTTGIRPDFLFPLTVGNNWEYAGISIASNIRNAPEGQSSPDTLHTFHSRLEITGADLLQDAIITYEFREITDIDSTDIDSDEFENQITSYNYYTLADNGLYRLAYDGSGNMTMKHVGTGQAGVDGENIPVIGIDMAPARAAIGAYPIFDGHLHYEPAPVWCLAYPLKNGLQWVYTQPNQNYLWNIEKRVIGRESVTVPAGTFDCYKIQWRVYSKPGGAVNEDMMYYDYISSIGLVKRHWLSKDMEMTSPSDPGGSYLCDMEETYELISYQVE